MQEVIFDIQHYAVHDGPGIRTIVFLKGCPLNCAWCCNPESQLFSRQLRYFDFKCRKCGACADACESEAVAFKEGMLTRSFSLCLNCSTMPCIERCNHDALQLTGKTYTVTEVLDIVSKDIPFYNNSGGGVTFSGGEPFSQPDFLFELLKECKTKNIHTAVETCGWCKKEDIEKSMCFVDLFLYDLKLMNDELHIKHTGKSNIKILENLKFLSASGKKIIVRFPLIPGITDTKENVNDVAEFMNSVQLNHICLEPYHTLGIGKYEELGMKYTLPELRNYTIQEMESVRKLFSDSGLNCQIV